MAIYYAGFIYIYLFSLEYPNFFHAIYLQKTGCLAMDNSSPDLLQQNISGIKLELKTEFYGQEFTREPIHRRSLWT